MSTLILFIFDEITLNILVQGVRGHNNPKMLFMKFELKNHKKPKKTIKNRKKHVLKQQKIKNRFFATLDTSDRKKFLGGKP